MANWREELAEAVKTKAEREAEEVARQKQRVQEALGTAQAAFTLALEALGFARDRIGDKGREVTLDVTPEQAPSTTAKLVLGPLSLALELDRETAVVRVLFADAKPREFDFARDRHIASTDVEEYVGRRVVDLVRSSQKASPW